MSSPRTTLIAPGFLIVALALGSRVEVASGQCQANELAKLTASDAAEFDYFGYWVAISGNLAVVGAPNDGDAGWHSGSAYVYRFDGSAWCEEARLTASNAVQRQEYGKAVAISGDVIVIGTPEPWGYEETSCGVAYVYRFNGSAWVEVAALKGSDRQLLDNFGYAAAISGDTIVVGAWQDDDAGDRTGSAYVFERPPAGWMSMTETAKLTASDAAALDEFGKSVAVSGDVVVVGALGNDDGCPGAGSAYVFERPANGWVDTTETAKLLASDPSPYDFLGVAVAINEDVVMVGSAGDDDHGPDSGAVYVYHRPAGGWVDMTETAKLTASDAQGNERFGHAVSLDDDMAVIGGLSADNFTGSAYVLRFDGEDWIEEAKLVASDADELDELGRSVGVSGDRAIAGAALNDDTGTDSGSAYVFHGLSDCNRNAVLDTCDIADGTSADTNGNGIPDECDCPGDLDGDWDVDLSDLSVLLSNYGTTGGASYEDGDLDADGAVDLSDLAALLAVYGTTCD